MPTAAPIRPASLAVHPTRGAQLSFAMTLRHFVKPAFSLRKKRSVKTHALWLSATKNLHFANAPFPRFSAKDFIYNQYLFYFLLTDEFNGQMEKLQKGASYPAVTDAEVKNTFLRYPKSLPEQQRIVAILDEAFAAIAQEKANAEQNLKNAKELFESYLQSVFENKGEGWVDKRLSDLCDIKHGFAFKSEYFSSEGNYVLLTPGNFYESGGYRDRGEI